MSNSLNIISIVRLIIFATLLIGPSVMETRADPYNVVWEILTPPPLNSNLNDAELIIDSLTQNIYLWGGVKGDYLNSSLWKNDLSENTWTGNQMNRVSSFADNQTQFVNNLMIGQQRNIIYVWNVSNQSVSQIKINTQGRYEIDFRPIVLPPWNTTIIRSIPIFIINKNQFLFLSEFDQSFVSENSSDINIFTSIFDLDTQSWLNIENSIATNPTSVSIDFTGSLTHNPNLNEVLYYSQNTQDISQMHKTWIFNLDTLKWQEIISESIPNHISGMGITFNQHLDMYIAYGGIDRVSQTYLSELWAFNSQIGYWEKITVLPFDMGYYSPGIVYNPKNNTIYVYGSLKNNEAANDLFSINIYGTGIIENLNYNKPFLNFLVGILLISLIIYIVHRFF